jgi:multidrug efflux pump
MMCSKLLRQGAKHGPVYRLLDRFFHGMTTGYKALLQASLGLRPLVVIVALGVASASYLLFSSLKSELAPVEDRGVVLGIGSAPEGSTIHYTTRYGQQLEQIFSRIPEVQSYIMVAGLPEVTRFISFARLKDWDERERSQLEIVAELFPVLSRIPGATIFPVNPPPFGQRSSSRPVQFVIQTSGTYDELQQHVDLMLDRARENPALVNVDTDLTLNKPQFEVRVNRDKILDSGLQVEAVGRTLESLLGGRQVTRFDRDGEQYDVVVQLAEADRSTPTDLSSIYVRSRDGAMIQLSNLVRVRETVAPKELNRFNQLRSAEVTANVAPGYSLGEALDFLDRSARELLPDDVQTTYAGQSREFKESGSSLYFVFILALLFIYLVLSAQFESFVDPLVIMLTVPLSMTGALLALYLTGGSLNVYSQIGLVTLVGLITKHGILIVEFANQLRERGLAIREAVVEAAVLRLRPILMTTGAMVLGAIPLALAEGAGAEGRQQIGWVVVGGMTLGTLLTLFVVPTAYLLLAHRGRAAEEESAQPQPAE